MFYDAVANTHGLALDPFKALVAPRPIGWISTLEQDRRGQSRALQLLQRRVGGSAFRDVRLGRAQGQPAQRRGDGRIRLLARHLRFARGDEQDIGRGRPRGRRDAACGPHARAVASGGAAARRGVAGRVRMPLLAHHRAAGPGRGAERACDRAGTSRRRAYRRRGDRRRQGRRDAAEADRPARLWRLCGDRRGVHAAQARRARPRRRLNSRTARRGCARPAYGPDRTASECRCRFPPSPRP